MCDDLVSALATGASGNTQSTPNAPITVSGDTTPEDAAGNPGRSGKRHFYMLTKPAQLRNIIKQTAQTHESCKVVMSGSFKTHGAYAATLGTLTWTAEAVMKLAYTILYVTDVAKALDFYRDAFGLKVKFLHESGDFGELDTGATTLAFSSRTLMAALGKTPRPADPHAPSSEIAFTTDDVAAAVDKAVATGATLIQKPEQMPWGQTVAYVADLDGFLVEICTPMAG